MNWKDLITPIPSITPDEARRFIFAQHESEYQLLDVRQPKEYIAEHIPGALLIPLGELLNRMAELDKMKPLIVYCAVGGRSKAAGQMLAAQGFKNVYNLVGGIKGWHGGVATGDVHEGFGLWKDKDDFNDVISLAYKMEKALCEFYRQLANDALDKKIKQLFLRLAEYEEHHMVWLAERFMKEIKDDVERFASLPEMSVIEGGEGPQTLVNKAQKMFQEEIDVYDMAVIFEIQAFDLYSRLSQRSMNDDAREFYLKMAEHEKKHITLIVSERDRQEKILK